MFRGTRWFAPSFTLLIWACAAETPLNFPSAPSEAEAEIAPLLTNTSTVEVSINDGAPFDWNLVPELEPDTLVIICPPKSKGDEAVTDASQSTPVTRVTFQSDLGRRTLSLTGYDSAEFDIVQEDVIAKTRVQCTFAGLQYRGDYSPGRELKSQPLLDIGPIFETYIKPNAPGGSITIWDQGVKTLDYSIGIGTADGHARQSDMPFDIASITKEFTAFAILKLIEEGQLTLETRLEEFFPGLPNGKDISVYHLLTHTHGLPDYTDADGFDASAPFDRAAALSSLQTMKAHFEPGEAYDYSNISFRLLALMIESLSGQTYQAFVRTQFFEPLGMTQSSFLSENAADNRVQGFWQSRGEFRPLVRELHDSHAIGNGNIVSTFSDLQKWYQALAAGRVVSADMFSLAATRQTLNDGTLIERGFGFHTDIIDGELVIHNSGDGYTHSRYLYFTKQDRLIILNTNNTIENHGYVASEIYLHVIGKILDQSSFQIYDEDIDLTDL